MGDNQKYYYMKLKADYFNSKEQVLMEKMQDGYLYSNILLKLYLLALEGNGKLMFTDLIPYNAEMIATLTRHQVGTVEKALQLFEQLKLIERFETGEIYMMDMQSLIGSTSTEADRKKAYRERIKEQTNELLLPSGQTSGQTSDKCPPEIRDKRLETRDKNSEPKAKSLEPISRDRESVTVASAPTRHQYGQYHNVLFTDDEFTKLKEEFPDWERRVERLSEYIASKGAKYKNHLATIRSWARKDKEKTQEKTVTNPALDYAQRQYTEDDFKDFYEDLS